MFSKTDPYENVLKSFGLSTQNLKPEFILSEYIKAYLESGVSEFEFITKKLPLYPSLELTHENYNETMQLADNLTISIQDIIDMLDLTDNYTSRYGRVITNVQIEIAPRNKNKTIITPGLNLTQPKDIDKLKGSQFEEIVQSQGYELSDFKNTEFVAQNTFLQQMQDAVNETIVEDREFIATAILEEDNYKILNKNFYFTGKLQLFNPDSGIPALTNIAITEPILINAKNSSISWEVISNSDDINDFGNKILFKKPENKKIRGHQLVLELN